MSHSQTFFSVYSCFRLYKSRNKAAHVIQRLKLPVRVRENDKNLVGKSIWASWVPNSRQRNIPASARRVKLRYINYPQFLTDFSVITRIVQVSSAQCAKILTQICKLTSFSIRWAENCFVLIAEQKSKKTLQPDQKLIREQFWRSLIRRLRLFMM